MRFRRRRAVRRTRKRRMQWLNGASLECSQHLEIDSCVEPTMNNVELFTLVDNPSLAFPGDVVGSANEVTVLRIVGEINFAVLWVVATAAQSWWETLAISWGIYVGDVDQNGAAIVKDPLAVEDMNSKDWLARGTYFTSECNLAGNTTFTCTENDPYTTGTNANASHLDVKVKRRMRPEESLILSVHAIHDDILGAQQATLSAQLQGNVRVLVAY